MKSRHQVYDIGVLVHKEQTQGIAWLLAKMHPITTGMSLPAGSIIGILTQLPLFSRAIALAFLPSLFSVRDPQPFLRQLCVHVCGS
jgi:hypothetical protein